MSVLDHGGGGSDSGSQMAPSASTSGQSGGGGVTETELLRKDSIKPEDVLQLKGITSTYLCPTNANVYNIDFVKFKIRDVESGAVLFEIAKPPDDEVDRVDQELEMGGGVNADSADETSGRFVRYCFTSEFLKLKSVGATVEFTIGSQPVHEFRMIERHYFKDRLLKTFDFDFGFCMPNSRNTCEHIYEFPPLDPDVRTQMIEEPFQTRSDSFYFVDKKLVMHNKADYSYNAGGEGD